MIYNVTIIGWKIQRDKSGFAIHCEKEFEHEETDVALERYLTLVEQFLTAFPSRNYNQLESKIEKVW